MNWVLIWIVLNGNKTTSGSTQFKNLNACNKVRFEIEAKIKSHNGLVKCYRLHIKDKL